MRMCGPLVKPTAAVDLAYALTKTRSTTKSGKNV